PRRYRSQGHDGEPEPVHAISVSPPCPLAKVPRSLAASAGWHGAHRRLTRFVPRDIFATGRQGGAARPRMGAHESRREAVPPAIRSISHTLTRSSSEQETRHD